MKEPVLRDYFNGDVSATVLNSDATGSLEKTGYDTFALHVEPFKGGIFHLKKNHLNMLCTDAMSKKIDPHSLYIIAESLMFSEYFNWDENDIKDFDIIDRVISSWSDESVIELTQKNLPEWEQFLLTGIDNTNYRIRGSKKSV